ncbi:MAG: DNA methyltransferase [Candidatus Aenigmarchaeota archaeon]|nr:DNA methyltransferase [Candidatus Aenigmarchaeota archaeon]
MKNRKTAQTTLSGKKIEDWDFAGADTSYLTHGIHKYPARMIPQIANRLIKVYSKEDDTILDPFCGSGTVLVESLLLRRNSVGNDINPLAVLLTKVKSTPIEFRKLNFNMTDFLSGINDGFKTNKLIEPPKDILPNLLHWFREDVACRLDFILNEINKVKNDDIKDFLKVVFSKTVFDVSNIDHRSSRFIRILQPDELSKFKPNTFAVFSKNTFDSLKMMNEFVREIEKLGLKRIPTVRITKNDARKLPFKDNEFDCSITSPPYGEEKNTIGYARWSKLSVAWLKMNHGSMNKAEKNALGSMVNKDVVGRLKELPSKTTINVLYELAKTDEERVIDALPFFFDYLKTFEEVYRIVKDGAYYCVVVGDRMIRKRSLDMEKVTVELGNAAGFRHVNSFFRKIPMKMIPWKTPTGETISRESIVIFQKV